MINFCFKHRSPSSTFSSLPAHIVHLVSISISFISSSSSLAKLNFSISIYLHSFLINRLEEKFRCCSANCWALSKTWHCSERHGKQKVSQPDAETTVIGNIQIREEEENDYDWEISIQILKRRNNKNQFVVIYSSTVRRWEIQVEF